MSSNSAIPEQEMHVTKRDGSLKTVEFDKILHRLKVLGNEADIKINYTALVIKVIDQIFDGISTTKIDELSAEQCASMGSTHYDYSTLAGRIVVSNHHKNTTASFREVMTTLYNFIDKRGVRSQLISDELYDIVCNDVDGDLDKLCDFSRDYLIDYFGFKTLERAYLMKVNNKTVERPQHMWLRVAIGMHGADMLSVKETYEYMSRKYFTHATPTLFNAGTPHPQLSSCFLQSMESDSIDGIYNTLKECALISKWAGGIGLHIHNVRASGSHIRGTNGKSNGIVPMLKVFNNTAKYVDQCIHPDTIIYTTEGPKQIKHCSVGETAIYNLDGVTEVIKDVLEHPYKGETLIIKTLHSSTPLQITPEHPVYVLRAQENDNNIIQQLENKLIDYEWTDAKDLTTNDMLVFPIPKHEQDISSISSDDCYMYGILLGNSYKDDIIYINSPNVRFAVEKYFTEKLINFRVTMDYGITCIEWNKSIHQPFRYNDLYNETKEKRIHNKWLHLPIEKSKYILKGLVDTQYESEFTINSKSKSMAESIRFLCMRMGALTTSSLRESLEGDDEYCTCIPKTREMCNLFEIEYDDKQVVSFLRHGDFMMDRIQQIDSEEYSGVLYDLQMTVQHNYLIHNGLVHNGGGRRNGSFAIYLEPWHADIEMFLQMRKNHGDEELKARDLFYAMWIPDLFMERIKVNGKWTLMCPDECPGLADVYGDEFVALYTKYETEGKGRVTLNARDLWFQILDAQMETGTPYILFKDACNKKSNQKNVGTIKSSNLCVAPETLILTDKGHIEIKELEGQKVNVWNGKEYSEVDVIKTGIDQEMIEIFTDDGSCLTCTPYHKFYIQENYSEQSIKMIEAQHLKPDDKLIKCDYPVIDGPETFLHAYTHGFFCGDGTYGNISNLEERPCKFIALKDHYFCKRHLDLETAEFLDKNQNTDNKCKAMSYSKKPIIYLYGEKTQLQPHMEYRSFTENRGRIALQLPLDMPDKFSVPSFKCSISQKLLWFAGYCDADGSISLNGDNEQLQVVSINYEFLQHVKLLLQTCGINPKIKLMRGKGQSYLPDGNGGNKYYDTQAVYRLLISSCELYKLSELGFVTKRLNITNNKPTRAAKHFIKILKIENNNRCDDTYCFTEPKRHMGVFNGILTGQCTEIVEYSDENETAVCNLASIALPAFVDKNGVMNYEELHKVSKVVTNNLNRVIDVNYYPTPKTERSNFRHRPVGIGVQGLADVFMLMGIPFHSDQAKLINKHIFETIYHAALEKSCELSQRDGPYETFPGSPASNGILQFDMWNVDPTHERYDWTTLKNKIVKHGLRNSLLMAPMPTASTSQILGYNECIEPITSNIYNRRTLAGEFIITNKYLMRDLLKLDLWNDKIKNNIISNNGSVQQIEAIPQKIRDNYKTVWELPMKHLIDMSADRGAYICQSQSLNLWLEDPNYNTLTSMHFYSWSKGLKTGIYYLRRRARHQAQKFTIEPERKHHDDEECEMCGA